MRIIHIGFLFNTKNTIIRINEQNIIICTNLHTICISVTAWILIFYISSADVQINQRKQNI